MSMDFDVKVDIDTDKMKSLLAEGIEKGLTMAAITVDKSAKVKTPVDTGRLRASIGYEVESDTATIGTNVEYATFIEYGHSRKAPDGFLRPALDENRGKINKMIADAIKAVLK